MPEYSVRPAEDGRWIVVNPDGEQIGQPYTTKGSASRRATKLKDKLPTEVINIEETLKPPTLPQQQVAETPPAEPEPQVEEKPLLERYQEALAAEPNMSKRKKAQWLVREGMSVSEAAKTIPCRYQQAYQATEEIRKTLPSKARCSVCGRPLSDPGHVQEGIGPVCRTRKELEKKAWKPRARTQP